LSDLSVGQMMKSNGMEASLVERYLTDSVACSGEDIQRSLQSLFIFCRQIQFGNNGQLHRLYYTAHARICQGGWIIALGDFAPRVLLYQM